MIKDVFKDEINKIELDYKLVEETKKKMAQAAKANYGFGHKRVIALAASFVVVALCATFLYFAKVNVSNPNDNTKNNVKANTKQLENSNKAVLPQVAEYYVPFNATEYQDIKCPSPEIALSYDELLQNSKAVVQCSIEDIGVYRMKSERYNPKASFGTYIYTVKIDKILQGSIKYKANDIIPIEERAWAWPTDYKQINENEINDWNFAPYTCRPSVTTALVSGKQYIMFLSKDIHTEFYTLTSCGFGVFPMDYLKQANTNNLKALENTYNGEENQAPLIDDIMYKICSLRTKLDFLK